MKDILTGLKRVSWDLSWFILACLFLFFVPNEWLQPEQINPKIAILATILTKGLYVTCGFLHAHITRKLAFNYIKFSEERRWDNNALVIVLYAVIIYSWAHGG